jgi:hypothetical protein
MFRMFHTLMYLCPEVRTDDHDNENILNKQHGKAHKTRCKHSDSGHGEEKKIRKDSSSPKTDLDSWSNFAAAVT